MILLNYVLRAKTCSRNNVPCVLTYQGALCAHLATCLACLRVKVPTCFACLHDHLPAWLACSCGIALCVLSSSRVNMFCVLMYSRVNVASELTSSSTNMLCIPCLTLLAWPRDHLSTCCASSVSSFNATFFSFAAIVVEVVNIVGKV